MASSSSSKVSLKLLIDTNAERVLFAEASKEFIDFLFNLLRLPVGTVTRLLTKKGMVGCLGKLYESIENLSDDYLSNPTEDKNMLLKASAPLVSGHLLPINDNKYVDTVLGASKLYICGNRCGYVAYALGTACQSCGTVMNRVASVVDKNKNTTAVKDASGGEGGFVKGVVTHTVMNDLEVCPMSTISTLTLISKFNVKNISSLEERIVELGMEEIGY